MKNIEKYMTDHDFLEADKKKVRDHLKCRNATQAELTRTTLYYTDKSGTQCEIGRLQLGIQENFI